MIHIAHALVADEGGKPGQEEEAKEEEVELEEHCSTFDVAVHRLKVVSDQENDYFDYLRVESSSEGEGKSQEVGLGRKTAPILNLECFHTGIS